MTPRLRTALLRVLCLLMLPTLACSANPFRAAAPADATRTPEAPAAAGAATPLVATQDTAVTPNAVAPPLRFTQALATDVESFNPILTADAASQAVIGLLLPRVLELDAQTGASAATGLAEGWEWSPEGATLTVTLRSDLRWSDGVAVTGRDVGFTFAALAAPAVESPLRARSRGICAQSRPWASIHLVFSLNQADCTFLQALTLPILPSHLFANDLSDIATNAWNVAPTVGAGPFLFAGRKPGEDIALVRNPAYYKGAPEIAAFDLRVVPSQEERMRLLMAGSIDLAEDLPTVASALAGGVRVAPILRDSFAMLAMNVADPAAPQPGRSEAGALLPQTPHPILGDLRVRQAIAQGMDVPRLVELSYRGDAAPITSWILPTTPWAYAADLPPLLHDPEAARALLDEAGWLVTDGTTSRDSRRRTPGALDCDE